MARSMKAAVVREFGKPLNIEEVPIPTPAPGEVLVKIMATGVCHTDLHAADGDWPVKPTPPFTLRGSIVGTRKDLAEAIEFASEGKVKAHIHQRSLEDINGVFADLKAGKVDGRIVVKF